MYKIISKKLNILVQLIAEIAEWSPFGKKSCSTASAYYTGHNHGMSGWLTICCPRYTSQCVSDTIFDMFKSYDLKGYKFHES